MNYEYDNLRHAQYAEVLRVKDGDKTLTLRVFVPSPGANQWTNSVWVNAHDFRQLQELLKKKNLIET